MDIFILNDGKEMGPFGEETAQTLINQGTVDAEDLAWRPGMTNWIPLRTLLAVHQAPGAVPGEKGIPPLPRKEGAPTSEKKPKEDAPTTPKEQAHSSPAPDPKAAEKVAQDEEEPEEEGNPATEEQKAFIAYLGLAAEEKLSRERAAALLNEARANPALAPRISQWNKDRARLHPELFSEEAQARKENRANHFLDVCHTEGAEYFSKVTKAHCQVLVTFLDGKFPTWDAHMKDAARDYFFPAVIEKFPQLVEPQWRDLFHYHDGSPSSSGGSHRPAVRRKKVRPPVTPLTAVVRGMVAGFIILGVLYLGQRYIAPRFSPPPAEQQETGDAEPSSSVSGVPGVPASPAPAAPAATAAATAPAPDPKLTKKEKKMLAKMDAPAGAPNAIPAKAATPAPAQVAKNEAPTPPEPAVPVAPAAIATPAAIPLPPPDPSMAPAPMAATAPATPPAPAETPAAPPVVTPAPAPAPDAAPTASTPTPGATPAADPTALPQKTNLVLTKPVELQLTYGKVKLPPGTAVKLVSRDGAMVKLNYLNNVIVVPANSTDIDSGAPAAPAPSSAPPPAPN